MYSHQVLRVYPLVYPWCLCVNNITCVIQNFRLVNNHIELYWTVLNCIELYWTVLNCIELFRTVLNCIELNWTILSCIKVYWSVLKSIEDDLGLIPSTHINFCFGSRNLLASHSAVLKWSCKVPHQVSIRFEVFTVGFTPKILSLQPCTIFKIL